MSVFQKIIDREIPAEIVFEDDHVLAFKDIHPQAPVHILIIPRKPLPGISAAREDDLELLGRMLLAGKMIAATEGLSDYRLVINNGPDAGQSVFHLHMHLLGGRLLSWPPG